MLCEAEDEQCPEEECKCLDDLIICFEPLVAGTGCEYQRAALAELKDLHAFICSSGVGVGAAVFVLVGATAAASGLAASSSMPSGGGGAPSPQAQPQIMAEQPGGVETGVAVATDGAAPSPQDLPQPAADQWDQDVQEQEEQEEQEEEERKRKQFRRLLGIKAAKTEDGLRYWAVLPSTCTLRLACDMFVHLASGLAAPPRHHGDDVRVRAVPCAARLSPLCFLLLPCWGGFLYKRDGEKTRWVESSAGSADGLLIPLSTSELLLRLPGCAELLQLRPRSSLGDEAVRRLPQLLMVAVGLASGSPTLALGSLGLLSVAGVLPWLVHRCSSTAAATSMPEARKTAQEMASETAVEHVHGAAEAAAGAAGAARPQPTILGAAVGVAEADEGAAEAAADAAEAHKGLAEAAFHLHMWCRGTAAPLLPVLPAFKRALDAVLLAIVVATSSSLGLILTFVTICGIAMSAFEAIALAWAPLLQGRASRCRALDRLLYTRAAELQVALNRASFCLASLAFIGLLRTLNPEAGAAVAVVLLVRFGNEVASNYEQEREVTTCDTKSAWECLGQKGLRILEQELKEHGWVQADGKFLEHVRGQKHFRGYEDLVKVMATMASIRDMVRAAEKPWLFAVVRKGAAGSVHMVGLTRAGYKKIPAGTTRGEVVFQERNTGRSPKKVENCETLETIAVVLNQHVEVAANAAHVPRAGVDAEELHRAVELLRNFELREVPRLGNSKPFEHKLQVSVVPRASQQLDRDTVCAVNEALNTVLFDALGRGKKKPSMFVVDDVAIAYPPTPPPEEVRLPIGIDVLVPENEEPPAEEVHSVHGCCSCRG